MDIAEGKIAPRKGGESQKENEIPLLGSIASDGILPVGRLLNKLRHTRVFFPFGIKMGLVHDEQIGRAHVEKHRLIVCQPCVDAQIRSPSFQLVFYLEAGLLVEIVLTVGEYQSFSFGINLCL